MISRVNTSKVIYKNYSNFSLNRVYRYKTFPVFQRSKSDIVATNILMATKSVQTREILATIQHSQHSIANYHHGPEEDIVTTALLLTFIQICK